MCDFPPEVKVKSEINENPFEVHRVLMKTIRTAKLGDLELRLVERDKQFIGLIFSGGPAKIQIEGSSADDVWRRLHDQAGKVNPKYFGFDGARARFLRFFPNGFHSADYESGVNLQSLSGVVGQGQLDVLAEQSYNFVFPNHWLPHV